MTTKKGVVIIHHVDEIIHELDGKFGAQFCGHHTSDPKALDVFRVYKDTLKEAIKFREEIKKTPSIIIGG